MGLFIEETRLGLIKKVRLMTSDNLVINVRTLPVTANIGRSVPHVTVRILLTQNILS